MTNAVLSSKGQIVIPKEIREKLGVHAGDRIQFLEEEGGFKIVPATYDIKELKGVVSTPKRPVTIEQMKRAVKARAAKMHSQK